MPDYVPEYKICHTCKLPKPAAEFYKRSKSFDGLHPNCIDCKHRTEFVAKWGMTYEQCIEKYGDCCNLCKIKETFYLRLP